MDLAVAMLPDPERPLRPGQPRSPPPPGAGMVASTRPLSGSIFWMRSLGDLEQVPAVEGGAGMRGAHRACAASCRSPGSIAFNVSPAATQTCRAVIADAADLVDARKGAVFADDRRRCSFHACVLRCAVASILAARQRRPGVTRLSGIPAAAAPSSGAPGRGRTTAPCRPPRARRAPAARCAGWRRAPAPAPTRPRFAVGQQRQHRRMRARRPAAPAPRPRGRGAAPARSRRSRSIRRRRAAPCAGGRSRRAAARDAIRRRAWRRRPARAAWPATRRRARPRRVRAPARTAPGASSSEITACRTARPVRQASTTSAFDASSASTSSSSSGRSLPRGDQPRRRHVETPAMRFRPRPRAQGCRPGARPLGACERGARRLGPQAPHRDPGRPPVRERPASAGGSGAGSKAREPCARPRRAARSAADAGSRDSRACAALARSPCALEQSRARRRAPSPASRDRARPARSRPRRRRSARGPPPRSARSARRAAQQHLRASEIAELRHGDAAQRQRRRIVAQGDPVQRAERITRRQRPRRGRDQRVHVKSRHTCHSHPSAPAANSSLMQQPARRQPSGKQRS